MKPMYAKYNSKKERKYVAVFFSLLILLILSVNGTAAEQENGIIFNGPFFENYGQGFSNWSGDSPIPQGTLLLKGSLNFVPDEVLPGDEIECLLDLSVSAMTLTGKDGAVLKNTQDRVWSVDTSRFMNKTVNFPVVPDSELLGIGIGSQVPDLINRDTKRIISMTIPDTAKPGVYPVRAFVNGTNLRTKVVNLTIIGNNENNSINATIEEDTPAPTEIPTPEITIAPDSGADGQNTDTQYAGMSEKIINERNLHVTSIYPYSGGAGNTMGIKVYGDHFASPIYVTLVKNNQGIDAYNYCFEENQKYGVVMIDIPADAEQGIWDLVITTRDGKATVPFEVTDRLIDPEIISIDAPLLTPDEGKDITISGKQMMEPCEILLANEDLKWFSFTPKPVLMHNTLKIRVKINAPLSDEVTSGQLDLSVWNGDGATSTYENAVSFSTETDQ